MQAELDHFTKSISCDSCEKVLLTLFDRCFVFCCLSLSYNDTMMMFLVHHVLLVWTVSHLMKHAVLK